jgi:DNA-binding Lrp family transcriptional regulator
MNKFEELQSTIITGTQFIKSYPMLNLIDITPSEKAFIELVLSYQLNGQKFYMEFSDIAKILGIKKQSVSNLVKSLKSFEYLATSNISVSNKKTKEFIGSTTFITINEDKIIASVQAALSNKPNLEAEIAKEAKKKAPKSIEPKVEVVVPEPIKEVVTNKQLTIQDELEARALPLVIEAAPTPIEEDIFDKSILTRKFRPDEEISMYELIPALEFENDTIDVYDRTSWFTTELDTSSPTLKEFIIFAVKCGREQKYNDYDGPRFTKEITDKINNLIKK